MEIELANSANRKQVDVKNEDGKKEKLFLYYDGETVSGKVRAINWFAYLANVDLNRHPEMTCSRRGFL